MFNYYLDCEIYQERYEELQQLLDELAEEDTRKCVK
jgi:hypothetical protein